MPESGPIGSHGMRFQFLKRYDGGCTAYEPLFVTADMIERGADEVRGALQQYYDGTIERIDPGSLAEDVLRAALSAAPRREQQS